MAHTTIKLAKLHGKPEIFHSIQGEGVSAGIPSIFIRASLCNLHCVWCDTDYTWNWQGTPWPHEHENKPGYRKFNRHEWIIEMKTRDVADIVTSFPCHNIILTGGEPLLQTPAWESLISLLRKTDPTYRFEVETNGTLIPSPELDTAVNQFNISPKLENSGNKTNLRRNPDALRHFARSPKAWFKFVVTSKNDLDEIHHLIHEFGLPRSHILLMPEGRDKKTLTQRRLWLADICRDNGFRFSDRLHIQLWGSKRGV